MGSLDKERSIDFDDFGRVRIDGLLIKYERSQELIPAVTLGVPTSGECRPGNCSTDV